MKKKTTAGILSLFLGGIGIHHLYLRNIGRFVLYLVFSFTGIPLLVSLVESLVFFTMSVDEFNERYNELELLQRKLLEQQLKQGETY